MITRRRIFQLLGGMGAAAVASRAWPLAASSFVDLPAFEQVPPSVSGLQWKHVAGISPQMYLPETNGAGCAFLDYDADGWMDIYLVNSGPCDFFQPKTPLRNALYRNNRDGTFTDVTQKAGVPGTAYGFGAAVGDYDRDGFPDLFVSQYPRNILYHNNGDGTFTDVTQKAGLDFEGWGTSAVWFDYDNDGHLDLFVCGFCDFSKDKNVYCGTKDLRVYCMPTVYPPRASWLFHNNGNGAFTDVTKESGIAQSLGRAWGVVAADVNNDGRTDLFVSNDKEANFLFVNRGKGKFEESGALAGVAYNAMGMPRSGMGVDAADVDQDGWLDLFVTNVDHEMFALYRNRQHESFDDIAIPTGIGPATMLRSGWGVKFVDYDNDGEVDLIICNGHPDTMVQKHIADVQYEEPMLLFRNNGTQWKNVSSESGPIFSTPIAARGLALGDFDNDGSVDVLVAINDGAPILLRNNAGRNNHWLGVRLIGKQSNIDAIGAQLRYKAGETVRQRTKVGGGGYLSSHDPRVVLGLGKQTKLDWLEVMWPQRGGQVERFTNVPIDRYITIVEGEGNWK